MEQLHQLHHCSYATAMTVTTSMITITEDIQDVQSTVLNVNFRMLVNQNETKEIKQSIQSLTRVIIYFLLSPKFYSIKKY